MATWLGDNLKVMNCCIWCNVDVANGQVVVVHAAHFGEKTSMFTVPLLNDENFIDM